MVALIVPEQPDRPRTSTTGGLRDDYVRCVHTVLPSISVVMRTPLARCLGRTGLNPGSWRTLVVGLTLITGYSPAISAQIVPGEGASIGSPQADRARLLQINGLTPRSEPDSSPFFRGWQRRLVSPSTRLTWNSNLPFEGNDGALWAGRGVSTSLTGGVSFSRRSTARRLDVVVAPVITHTRNRPFPTRTGRDPTRSAFSSPWYTGLVSADLPLRFGDLPLTTVGLGQSSITFTSKRYAAGLSAANEWWGPAIRNTLLLSSNAAGIPRAFARTSEPLRTRFGSFDGRAFIGALTESPYFDQDSRNDVRAVSGVLVTYRPAIDSGLTLGLSRIVVAPARSAFAVVVHPFDGLLTPAPSGIGADTAGSEQLFPRSDHLISLFARWTFPQSGFETYAEWARTEMPSSLRALLEAPQHTQAYTLGLQWADARNKAAYLRVQTEISYLEQTQAFANVPTLDYYTGRAAIQGFTQRGQVLGAAIGPGASSQFIAADWMANRWQSGVFAGRERTENDALYREGGPRITQHDVTVYSGVRGGVRLARSDVFATVTVGQRYNYLLQSLFYLSDGVNALDIRNTTVTITVTPR